MTALVDTGNSAMYLPEQIFDNFKVRRKEEKREEGMEGWRDFGRRYEIKEGSEEERGEGRRAGQILQREKECFSIHRSFVNFHTLGPKFSSLSLAPHSLRNNCRRSFRRYPSRPFLTASAAFSMGR